MESALNKNARVFQALVVSPERKVLLDMADREIGSQHMTGMSALNIEGFFQG
jgi:hypothetical protein